MISEDDIVVLIKGKIPNIMAQDLCITHNKAYYVLDSYSDYSWVNNKMIEYINIRNDDGVIKKVLSEFFEISIKHKRNDTINDILYN